jgi:hypothetical protein
LEESTAGERFARVIGYLGLLFGGALLLISLGQAMGFPNAPGPELRYKVYRGVYGAFQFVMGVLLLIAASRLLRRGVKGGRFARRVALIFVVGSILLSLTGAVLTFGKASDPWWVRELGDAGKWLQLAHRVLGMPRGLEYALAVLLIVPSMRLSQKGYLSPGKHSGTMARTVGKFIIIFTCLRLLGHAIQLPGYSAALGIRWREAFSGRALFLLTPKCVAGVALLLLLFVGYRVARGKPLPPWASYTALGLLFWMSLISYTRMTWSLERYATHSEHYLTFSRTLVTIARYHLTYLTTFASTCVWSLQLPIIAVALQRAIPPDGALQEEKVVTVR